MVPALEMSGVAVSTSSLEIGPRESTVTERGRREAGIGKRLTDRNPRFLFTGVVWNSGLAGLVPGDLPGWSDAIKALAIDASPRVCPSHQAMVRVKAGSRLAIPDEMIDVCQKLLDNITLGRQPY